MSSFVCVSQNIDCFFFMRRKWGILARGITKGNEYSEAQGIHFGACLDRQNVCAEAVILLLL